MHTLTNALILAAGRGTRLREDGGTLPKPLHRIHGRTLAERTISTLADAGIKRFVVVLGFEADQVRDVIASDPRLTERDISVEFAMTWGMDKAHGASVLPAREFFTEPFVLSMCDHVYDVEIARLAATADMNASDLYLCVDRRVDDIYDIDDATKVRTDGDLIVDIGKEIKGYNAIDCGVFAVGVPLLDELSALWDETGDAGLSDGVLRLGRRGRAHVVDIGNAFWQDVDTPGALTRAEGLLSS